jgi:RNA polymerase sigma factor (sigma-70 family)
LRQINWEEIYRKNAAQLKGVCRRYVYDQALADDLVQETFVTAIDKFPTYRGIGSIEGWIRKIAINKALQYVRKNQYANLSIESLVAPVEQEPNMEPSINTIRTAIEQASFSCDELLAVIDSLPPHHKIVFNLYVVDGYSHVQIARMMDISPGTSKSHLARARKKAQELLYEKAIQRQPEKKQIRNSAWMLLLIQPNYIDRVFQKGMKGFGMAATPPGSSVISAPVHVFHWGATLAGKIVLWCAISMVSIGGTSLYLLNSRLKNDPKFDVLKTFVVRDSAITAQPDSLNIDSVQNSHNTIPDRTQVSPTERSPVIVKKQIVVHDTIKLEKLSK